MQAPLANGKQVVEAINGTVEAVDVFQSTPLFQKRWPKRLKPDALDAPAGAIDKEARKQATVDDARKFLDAARAEHEHGGEHNPCPLAGLDTVGMPRQGVETPQAAGRGVSGGKPKRLDLYYGKVPT